MFRTGTTNDEAVSLYMRLHGCFNDGQKTQQNEQLMIFHAEQEKKYRLSVEALKLHQQKLSNRFFNPALERQYEQTLNEIRELDKDLPSDKRTLDKRGHIQYGQKC
jgi:hypothetical protein